MNQDVRGAAEAEFLLAQSVSVRRLPGGELLLLAAGRRWENASVRMVFPLTQTERMLAFTGPEDEYLGTVRDFHELDVDSRRVIQDELAQSYFRPNILRILRLRKRFGLVEMDAVTSAGPRLIRFRSPRDDIRELGPGRYLLTDATGNRFEIPCLETLDDPSRALWHNLV